MSDDGMANVSITRVSITNKHSQAKLEQAGDTVNEQCLITKALGGVTRITRLKMRVENLAEFRLGESSE